MQGGIAKDSDVDTFFPTKKKKKENVQEGKKDYEFLCVIREISSCSRSDGEVENTRRLL